MPATKGGVEVGLGDQRVCAEWLGEAKNGFARNGDASLAAGGGRFQDAGEREFLNRTGAENDLGERVRVLLIDEGVLIDVGKGKERACDLGSCRLGAIQMVEKENEIAHVNLAVHVEVAKLRGIDLRHKGGGKDKKQAHRKGEGNKVPSATASPQTDLTGGFAI